MVDSGPHAGAKRRVLLMEVKGFGGSRFADVGTRDEQKVEGVFGGDATGVSRVGVTDSAWACDDVGDTQDSV